ncbi:MAG: glycosyltransferase family 2 protein [Porticoccaceae bacterium]|nr:glycosyltransferase family 2 protein [Porticoccaceae bacterium]
MSTTTTVILTLLSGLLVIYHHAVYPLILQWLQRKSERHGDDIANKPQLGTENLPRISLLIPAYNEAQWIADKIRNLAILNYPENRLHIIVACDGCSDDTVAIARQTAAQIECRHLDIEVRNYPENRGKVAVINEVVEELNSELLALSDVSALISIDALLIAAHYFRDPHVGVLSPHYRLLNPGSVGELSYWNYQSHMKACEAALGATLGAHGAFYVLRRNLFTPLAADTINDDFILPMNIVMQGFRAEYAADIHALELEQANDNMDWQRRRRIGAGNCQQLLRLKKLLLPRYRGIAFAFMSGKGLRVLMPFCMLIALFGSIYLAQHHWLFIPIALAQILLYQLALLQLVLKPKRQIPLLESLAYLVRGHCASLMGTLRYLAGFERGRWQSVKPD